MENNNEKINREPFAGFAEARLLADIELAKNWCAASKVIESPGGGEGWRHTCYRLALEVERLRAMSANDPSSATAAEKRST